MSKNSISELTLKIEELIKAEGYELKGAFGELVGPFDPYGLEKGKNTSPEYWEWGLAFTIRENLKQVKKLDTIVKKPDPPIKKPVESVKKRGRPKKETSKS